MRYVYLAGPMEGCTDSEMTEWRDHARELLGPGIRGISPTRGPEYHREPTSIMRRDEFDVRQCDVLLANLSYGRRAPLGTVMEIGWAYILRKPVILVSGRRTATEHPMVASAVTYEASTLEEAVGYIRAMLGVYVEQREGATWEMT